MQPSPIKAAIIDDEMHCIKTLSYLLTKKFPDIELVFTTTDSSGAKDLTDIHKPDILFLDIEMPGLNGLQFLSSSYLRTPFVLKDGALEVPTGAGLGVEVDEEKLRKVKA